MCLRHFELRRRRWSRALCELGACTAIAAERDEGRAEKDACGPRKRVKGDVSCSKEHPLIPVQLCVCVCVCVCVCEREREVGTPTSSIKTVDVQTSAHRVHQLELNEVNVKIILASTAKTHTKANTTSTLRMRLAGPAFSSCNPLDMKHCARNPTTPHSTSHTHALRSGIKGLVVE